MSATKLGPTGAVLALALALGPGGPSASGPRHEPLQLADMGMGPAGPELGGSQDDMVLEDPGYEPPEAQMDVGDPGHIPGEAQMDVGDPGHVPAEAQMDVTDPGYVPPEAQMDIQQPMDDDLQDDILE